MGALDWKSYREQLHILKSRGLEVEDEPTAVEYLERIGYYRLSGYWYPFRQLKPLEERTGQSFRYDSFSEGSRFQEVVELYVFDKKLRLLALDALERIEMAVRVDVAHLLGHYNAFAHYDKRCFGGNFTRVPIKKGKNQGQFQYDLCHKNYERLVRRANKEHFVIHNLDSHSKLPIWVAIEVFDFGALSILFSGMKYLDKDRIAKKYNSQGKEFERWLRSLNFIRNVSAHHSRLWNIDITESSNTPQFLDGYSELSSKRPYFYFQLMGDLLKVINPRSTWKERLNEHLETFPQVTNNIVSLKDLGRV